MSNHLVSIKKIDYAQDIVFVGAQSAGLDSTLSTADQIATTIAKLREILHSASMTFDDVVKIGLFYHQSLLDEEQAIFKALKTVFGSATHTPVLTPIPLHHLPHGEALQIELIALKPRSRRSEKREVVSQDPVHGFSKAIRCDDLIFVGGKMSIDGNGNLVNANEMVGQARTTMDNLKSAIKELRADPQSVVKLNTYYVGFGTTNDWSMAARVRSDAFVKPGPGATGVPVPGPYPGGALLRQEAIAIVNKDGSPKHRDTSWPEGVWDWPIKVSFEQGLKIDDLIILGGQVSASTIGEAVYPGDLKAQTRRIMETINTILGGFNINCDCLAKLTILYATKGDPADRDAILDIVSTFFSKTLPALTLIPLGKLGFEGIEIEIEGIGSIN